MTDPILTTDNLFLRKLCDTDFDDLCEILQDKETMYTYEHTLSDEEAKGWYDKQIDRYQKDGFGLWAVVNKNTDDFLGMCGLTIQNINEIEYIEIGYMFKKKYWHHGYATEAAIGCKKYANDTLKAEKVYSIMRDNNIPSQNVATRVGMIKTGEVIKRYRNVDMLHFIFEIDLSKAKQGL